MANNLALPLTEDSKKAWQNVRTRKNRYAIWKLTSELVEIDVSGNISDNVSNFMNALSDTQCRYCVYDHEFKTKDGRIKSVLLFISWTPHNSNQNDKILYSQQRHAFKESLNGTVHHNVNTKKEIEKIIQAVEGNKDDSDGSDDD